MLHLASDPTEPRLDPVEAARTAKRDFKRKLKENKAKNKAAADAAPSLMTRLKMDTAKDKARASALRRIAKAVYGTADPAELRNVAADEDIFDDDDRAFLELAAGDDDFDDDYGED